MEMDKVLQQVAKTVEKSIDDEIERLDTLDASDLEALRARRLAEMKAKAQCKQQWLINGHGEYTQLSNEKEFFAATGRSERLVCHFSRRDEPRCDIMDMHLKILAKKHIETKFVKLDAEKAPFLIQRLRIRMAPTLALVLDNKTEDFVAGLAELGGRDDFSTDVLEWRLAKSRVIDYNGDPLGPPPAPSKRAAQAGTIRQSSRGDSDLELSD